MTLAGEEAGEGIPVVLLHGLTATRRYVVMGSRALERCGPPRDRLRRARARRSRARRPTRTPTTTTTSSTDLLARARRPRDRARRAGGRLDGRAHAACGSRSTQPERVAGLVIATPAFDPDADRATGARALGRAVGRPAQRRRRRLRRGLRRRRRCPSRGATTVDKVLRQRLAAHEHPDARGRRAARGAALAAVRDAGTSWRAIEAPTVSWRAATRPIPATRTRSARPTPSAIPGARLVSEEPGSSPLAWQGGQLSKVISELAERAGAAGP